MVVDLDPAACQRIADDIGGIAVAADVRDEAQVQHVVDTAEHRVGSIDLFHSNAGGGGNVDVFGDDIDWQAAWELQVMASVYASRAVLPGMLDRGSGYLVGTASGAALTAEPGALAYSVTKHAMLDLYEVLAIQYGHRGIHVSCFCPFGMLTPMLLGSAELNRESASAKVGMTGAVTPEFAADAVGDAIRTEQFLIVSHPEALTYFARKASDYERWLNGMRRVYAADAST